MEEDTFADIGAVLLGEMQPETAENRAAVRLAVQEQVVCPYSNVLLDVRTSVLFEIAADGKAGMEVVDFLYWKKIEKKLAARCAKQGATLTVYNGKELFR